MIAGFGGELVSHAYAEQQLLPSTAKSSDLDAFERQLLRWWRGVGRTLGPASSARAVLDTAVLPLVSMLGHRRPTMSAHQLGLSGVIDASRTALLVLPWSVPVRGAALHSTRLGLSASAEWAMVANGRSLSIIDCTRTWTRARIEFDFERLVTSPKGVAVLWLLATASSALRQYVRASDAHASRVCGALGDGVLDALPRLASALGKARQSSEPLRPIDQALTVIYRVLFLLFAEARGVVPTWHDLYRDAYSIDGLARKAGEPGARGLWPTLQAISRLAHAGCQAADLTVTPFNGRLFSPRHAPLGERRHVDERVIREVLLALATEPTPLGRRRISYYDLGVEQLGAVYERVLDQRQQRKSTGSFYTPRSMTEFLVRQTLAPLVEGKSAEQILSLRVLDPAMGSGAFLVAACQYLADQCEIANIRDGRWVAGDVTATDRATLRRLVAERCLYGVDANPTAVQLARLSMWLTTLAADRPLTFLDHHLAAGNSLVGARLADLSRPPRRSASTTTGTLPLFEDQLAGALSAQVLPARFQLALTASDSIGVVKEKERTLAALSAPGGAFMRWWRAADAWCGALLSPGTPPSCGLVAEWVADATGGATTLPVARLRASLNEAVTLAQQQRAFHWELAFPEIFFTADGRPTADGGFDAVIGNPPWSMLRGDPVLRFHAGARQYALQGRGHVNLYQLFLERALHLAKPRGRVGLILPSGIATDHGSTALRRHLFGRTSIDTWLGFDNRKRIFPIHRSMRFVVVCATNSGETDTLRFRSGLTDTAILDDPAASPPLSISRSRLESWSPALCVPEVPDATALAILSGVSSRAPALGESAGWNVRFGRELNATDDRPHFARRQRARDTLVPVIEGKLLSPFQVAVDRASMGIPLKSLEQLMDRRLTQRARIGYRDVASATNKLTLIAAMLPPRTVSTHTVFVSKATLDEDSQWCLLGLLNSLVANYLIRLRVTTHVTTATMASLPVPRPATDSDSFSTLASLSRQLSLTGIDGGADAYAHLNALAAQLYGLTADQFAYVLATFPLIASDVRARCVALFQQLTRKHGNTETRKPE